MQVPPQYTSAYYAAQCQVENTPRPSIAGRESSGGESLNRGLHWHVQCMMM